MSDLLRTLILCGILSGTQPITLMGLLLVMTGPSPRRNGSAFIAGAFLVETTILIGASIVVGGVVEPSSGAGRSFIWIRFALGVALFVAGVLLRRPARKPAPEVPAALARLQGLTPTKTFVAGVALADYQGPFVGAMALAAADVSAGGRLLALIPYTVIATGIPVVILLTSTRSDTARQKLTDGSNWVVAHRRQLGSWFGIVLGGLLIGDAIVALLLA